MIRTLSSRLTAHFRPDGSHLERYIRNKPTITRSLCEDLILHDQVLIPTTDYLTASGLICLIGEGPFISLLEQERIKFVRTRCVFGFGRGKLRDGGLAVFSDPESRRPQDAPIENSVAAALACISSLIQDPKKLHQLIARNSHPAETAKIIESVEHEAVQDFKKSRFWRSSYECGHPTLVALPGLSKMQVRVAGAEYEEKRRAVDALLSLVVYNSDLYLAQQHMCTAVSSVAPIGDLIDLKAARITDHASCAWELFEVNGVPDLAHADLQQPDNFAAFNRLISGSTAREFRVWFHSRNSYNRTELMREYITVLKQVPWISRMPSKLFRFLVTTGLGMIPGAGPVLGAAAGGFDAFVVDQLFRPKSPKFFLDDLNRVAGVLTAPKKSTAPDEN
jgi:hypothetical protein